MQIQWQYLNYCLLFLVANNDTKLCYCVQCPRDSLRIFQAAMDSFIFQNPEAEAIYGKLEQNIALWTVHCSWTGGHYGKRLPAPWTLCGRSAGLREPLKIYMHGQHRQ